jgi:hypothetical protein
MSSRGTGAGGRNCEAAAARGRISGGCIKSGLKLNHGMHVHLSNHEGNEGAVF